MSEVSTYVGVAVRMNLGQVFGESQVRTDSSTASAGASSFFRITSRVIRGELHRGVSSAETPLISPGSAILADACPASSKPFPFSAERTDRDRFGSSCARGVRFAP